MHFINDILWGKISYCVVYNCCICCGSCDGSVETSWCDMCMAGLKKFS